MKPEDIQGCIIFPLMEKNSGNLAPSKAGSMCESWLPADAPDSEQGNKNNNPALHQLTLKLSHSFTQLMSRGSNESSIYGALFR